MDTISMEGLKQAFLDHQVKIRFIGEKVLSTHPKILSLQVSQGFFADETFNFHSNLNCLVGGKGVGKSYTIELIRFALDNMSDFPIIREDADSKIKKLLGEGGKVTLIIEDEKGRFRVERTMGAKPEKSLGNLQSPRP